MEQSIPGGVAQPIGGATQYKRGNITDLMASDPGVIKKLDEVKAVIQ